MPVARNGRGGLGRGLNSLLGGAYEEAIPQEESQRVRVEAEQSQQSQSKPQPEREVIRDHCRRASLAGIEAGRFAASAYSS